MRDLASGRKNFLFSGSDEAAKNFAFAYSLTQSCKLNHVNPYVYWEDLIANAHNLVPQISDAYISSRKSMSPMIKTPLSS